ncbi:Polypeptide N-acetylgalactosaminyltransferase 2 (Polypeptide GalNAc transferase 2) (GalNAc-T2) (pp-GaNTase 2) (Protein-UDP acetylgalactosaminyltransferase 2) (UDP-GalNAc:polypeptide N-acetylgalactosaminyltransferase 2) [Cleaved into: Polypeptide N-acetylgalactosaminyltransferase 2 soluble form] [Durusdinium trenchii]|uniref:Ricin B lectin domain-containing protein n=1 Tax=Durusdinium trenchii TaxID=1381693 RepID=A0ABP0K4X4_9DINO
MRWSSHAPRAQAVTQNERNQVLHRMVQVPREAFLSRSHQMFAQFVLALWVSRHGFAGRLCKQGYDPEMRLYGGEEMEIGFRTWMCGGDIEYLPCSHVGHIFRTPKYWQGQVYRVPGEEISRNKLRTAEVWMDEFQSLVKFAAGPLPPSLPIGNLEPRKQLRRKLQCKDFRWYLQTVTPHLFVPKITPDTKGGALRNQVLDACLDTLGSHFPGETIGAYPCHGQHGTQAFVEDTFGLMRVPQLGYKMCLSHEGTVVAVRPCKDSDLKLQWSLDPDLHLKSSSGQCMEVKDAHTEKSPYTLVGLSSATNTERVADCSKSPSQEWHWA